jgi:hypothetical protein
LDSPFFSSTATNAPMGMSRFAIPAASVPEASNLPAFKSPIDRRYCGKEQSLIVHSHLPCFAPKIGPKRPKALTTTGGVTFDLHQTLRCGGAAVYRLPLTNPPQYLDPSIVRFPSGECVASLWISWSQLSTTCHIDLQSHIIMESNQISQTMGNLRRKDTTKGPPLRILSLGL